MESNNKMNMCGVRPTHAYAQAHAHTPTHRHQRRSFFLSNFKSFQLINAQNKICHFAEEKKKKIPRRDKSDRYTLSSSSLLKDSFKCFSPSLFAARRQHRFFLIYFRPDVVFGSIHIHEMFFFVFSPLHHPCSTIIICVWEH